MAIVKIPKKHLKMYLLIIFEYNKGNKIQINIDYY